jgi:hypothetical protein
MKGWLFVLCLLLLCGLLLSLPFPPLQSHSHFDYTTNPNVLRAKTRPSLLRGPLVWLHFPKAGTSFWNTLIHYCAPTLPLSVLVPHHRGACLYWQQSNGENFTDWEHCFVICRGHTPLFLSETEKSNAVAFFRNPTNRIFSSFYNNRRGVPQNESPTIRHPRQYFAYPGVLGCQTKMLTGHSCLSSLPSHQLPQLVEKAKEILSTHMAFVGLTERWAESICLFHAMYGGHTSQFEFTNSRPALIDENDLPIRIHQSQFNLTDPYDNQIYQWAEHWFEEQKQFHQKEVTKCLIKSHNQKL